MEAVLLPGALAESARNVGFAGVLPKTGIPRDAPRRGLAEPGTALKHRVSPHRYLRWIPHTRQSQPCPLETPHSSVSRHTNRLRVRP